MQNIIIMILLAAVVVLFFKNLGYKSSLAAYLRYFEEQKMKEPTPETLREYQEWAVRNMIKDWLRLK